MTAENAAMIAEAREFAHQAPGKYALVTRLADALEQTEAQLATVRRSADEWWSLYDGELKKAETTESRLRAVEKLAEPQWRGGMGHLILPDDDPTECYVRGFNACIVELRKVLEQPHGA